MTNTRGYFGIGVEGISKAMNVGSIMRSAHAFGASFVFTVGAIYQQTEGGKSDTSDALDQLPLYEFDDVSGLRLPKTCSLVGVELIDDAADLPSFRHPGRCAYVLGSERGSLSPELLALCDHSVKIPTQFCVNVGVAAAIVMYDRPSPWAVTPRARSVRADRPRPFRRTSSANRLCGASACAKARAKFTHV